MIFGAYQALLRSPDFRGKSRLLKILRGNLSPNIVSVQSGLRMQLDPREHVQNELIKYGVLERPTIELFKKLLRSGDTYVDVGAHVGFHTLVARSLVGDASRVLAVDPQPYNCSLILVNAELNSFDNIEVVVAAAGAAPGFVRLNNQPVNDKAKLSLNPNWVHPECAQTFSVPVRTLDEITTGIEVIGLLKIDVESFEVEVLRGASDTLRKSSNVIVELHPEATGARLAAECLEQAGFVLCDVAGNLWRPGQPAPDHNVWGARR
jgi:FkbM family methyltransferase